MFGIYEEYRHQEILAIKNRYQQEIKEKFSVANNGNISYWNEILNGLPEIDVDNIDLESDIIRINSANIRKSDLAILEEVLYAFKPWRKGPFELFGIKIESEWQSYIKWNNLLESVMPLNNKSVLDVGCGNGYYALKMLAEGAKVVVGIDPTLIYLYQFFILNKFIETKDVSLFPFRLEEIIDGIPKFDMVFSMGVIYHVKSPFEHLFNLKKCLKFGGKLILESLIVDGNENTVFTPLNRYAKMKNVWFIPSVKALLLWLKKTGFKNIELINIRKTTFKEQKASKWISLDDTKKAESLRDFLNPFDDNFTIEGYPAPKRAVLKAEL